jgi:HAMP domain-containing protein/F0F1-type ATP synthase membrane subunit c/vacuolar-type H+-ATPase subunit K
MTDLYRVLGVSPRATAAEIKSAYRRLARKCHPDVSASPDANANFARINEAYHVLSDARLRASYDRGDYGESRRTFYASRTAEVVALQREFDRMVDEMIAHDRQETAARSHAVLVVVPLFLSTFYVMVAKPTFMEESRLIGRVLIIALALYGLVYLIRNIALVLTRYTYPVPAELISVFHEEAPRDKPISRRAGLSFLIAGYLVSLGLGYVVGKFVPSVGLSVSTILSLLLYPPIAVLVIGGIRRVSIFLERF